MLRAAILAATAALALAVVSQTATASTSTKGSSCAHPYAMYYSSYRGERWGEGMSKVSWDLDQGHPQVTAAAILYNMELSVAPKSGYRICKMKGEVSPGNAPDDPPHVTCTRGIFSSRGWTILGPRGASCTVTTVAGTDAGIKLLTITVARKRKATA